jgi:predicted TIM-barrel fold metal-dependent hydrolase
MFSHEPFRCAVSALGEDAVMFSVDHPFESMMVASAWFDKLELLPEHREKAAWKNAS